MWHVSRGQTHGRAPAGEAGRWSAGGEWTSWRGGGERDLVFTPATYEIAVAASLSMSACPVAGIDPRCRCSMQHDVDERCQTKRRPWKSAKAGRSLDVSSPSLSSIELELDLVVNAGRKQCCNHYLHSLKQLTLE
ncbi:hypothetical protein DBV15_02522 [Temnothorax longispinosus]|uniref:Uncharacterized protein n=1 Tax=Temnothorax longispinosus TaxID=300112 RepID=A0A4S2KS49_9HYME|nr:hypothetical protein DBV15_02522 [Temnothorax longispinosus]